MEQRRPGASEAEILGRDARRVPPSLPAFSKSAFLRDLQALIQRCRALRSFVGREDRHAAGRLASELDALEEAVAAQIDDYMAGQYARHAHAALVRQRTGVMGEWLSGIWQTRRSPQLEIPRTASRCVACCQCVGVMAATQTRYGRVWLHQRCAASWLHRQDQRMAALERRAGVA